MEHGFYGLDTDLKFSIKKSVSNPCHSYSIKSSIENLPAPVQNKAIYASKKSKACSLSFNDSLALTTNTTTSIQIISGMRAKRVKRPKAKRIEQKKPAKTVNAKDNCPPTCRGSGKSVEPVNKF